MKMAEFVILLASVGMLLLVPSQASAAPACYVVSSSVGTYGPLQFELQAPAGAFFPLVGGMTNTCGLTAEGAAAIGAAYVSPTLDARLSFQVGATDTCDAVVLTFSLTSASGYTTGEGWIEWPTAGDWESTTVTSVPCVTLP